MRVTDVRYIGYVDLLQKKCRSCHRHISSLCRTLGLTPVTAGHPHFPWQLKLKCATHQFLVLIAKTINYGHYLSLPSQSVTKINKTTDTQFVKILIVQYSHYTSQYPCCQVWYTRLVWLQQPELAYTVDLDIWLEACSNC